MEDKKKNRAMELKAREEDPEATFKPVTLDYASRSAHVTHGDKCLDLFSRVKGG